MVIKSKVHIYTWPRNSTSKKWCAYIQRLTHKYSQHVYLCALKCRSFNVCWNVNGWGIWCIFIQWNIIQWWMDIIDHKYNDINLRNRLSKRNLIQYNYISNDKKGQHSLLESESIWGLTRYWDLEELVMMFYILIMLVVYRNV